MKIVFEFIDGKELIVEVQGQVKEYYLELAGIDPESAPEILNLSKLEARTERKHFRSHKYTGLHVSFDGIKENGEQVADHAEIFSRMEIDIDLFRAMDDLTEIQRVCFMEVCIYGKTQRDVATELNKSKTFVAQAIKGAKNKLKNYFKSI